MMMMMMMKKLDMLGSMLDKEVPLSETADLR